jgi:hypothetical protein
LDITQLFFITLLSIFFLILKYFWVFHEDFLGLIWLLLWFSWLTYVVWRDYLTFDNIIFTSWVIFISLISVVLFDIHTRTLTFFCLDKFIKHKEKINSLFKHSTLFIRTLIIILFFYLLGDIFKNYLYEAKIILMFHYIGLSFFILILFILKNIKLSLKLILKISKKITGYEIFIFLFLVWFFDNSELKLLSLFIQYIFLVVIFWKIINYLIYPPLESVYEVWYFTKIYIITKKVYFFCLVGLYLSNSFHTWNFFYKQNFYLTKI